MRSGTPAGTNPSTAIATTAAARAIASGSRARSRGARRARNAAGGAASRPSTFGFENAWAATAPPRVPRFQRMKRAAPVAQNANRLKLGSSRAIAIAVVSSITKCAAMTRRRPRTPSKDESRNPKSAFREPSSAAAAAPAHTLPPPPITPTSANCEAPVNTSTDSAHVWSTDNPAALEIAPNEIAYAPLAIAMPRASRTIPFRGSADLVAVRSDDVPGGAEVVDALSGGISGIVIGDDVVKRVTAICDLNRPVVTLGRPEQRGVDPGARLRGAAGQERRPVRGARAVARGRCSLVSFEEIEGAAAAVDKDLAQRRVCRDRHSRSRRGRGR